jgi:small subunit ribosomal protein S13
MYKFQDTELKYNRRVRDSLIDIYGVGFQKASYVCDFLGLGNSFNINLLNNYFYELMIIIFKYYYILEERLRNLIFQRLDFFLEIRRIVGLRLLKGLPVRGQRTQSNRQNARKLRPLLVKKDEIIAPIVIKSSKGKDKSKKTSKGQVNNKSASKKGKKK